MKKYKMSRKKWNSLYANRGPRFITYAELKYKDKDTIIVTHKLNLLGQVVSILLYPILLLIVLVMGGLNGAKGLNKDYFEHLRGKGYSHDYFSSTQDKHWQMAVELLGEYEN